MKTFNVGSPSYMSPEAYLKTLYSEKSDSWSLGVILYEMIHGKTLDEGRNIREFYEQIKLNQDYISKHLISNSSSQVREIIEKSLRYAP
jgi:serine/threonine protein kinase